MASTFKVGDKVRHDIRGVGEISYGPFDTSQGGGRYLHKDMAGHQAIVRTEFLTALPAFSVGDKANAHGLPAEIVGGPFDGPGGTWYAYKSVDGLTYQGNEKGFAPVAEPAALKVGDRVRVLEDDPLARTGEYVGMVGELVRVKDPADGYLPFKVAFGTGLASHGDRVNGAWNCRRVEKVADVYAHTYNGVPYDLSARYRDCDGDVWRFASVDGVVRGRMRGQTITEDSDLLSDIAEAYGPLTRV